MTSNNETTKLTGKQRGSWSPLMRLVMWLCPKTIERLQFLNDQKTRAFINYCNYRMIRGTNHGKGGQLAKSNFEECSRFYNANKYWWMEEMPSSVELMTKGQSK